MRGSEKDPNWGTSAEFWNIPRGIQPRRRAALSWQKISRLGMAWFVHLQDRQEPAVKALCSRLASWSGTGEEGHCVSEWPWIHSWSLAGDSVKGELWECSPWPRAMDESSRCVWSRSRGDQPARWEMLGFQTSPRGAGVWYLLRGRISVFDWVWGQQAVLL